MDILVTLFDCESYSRYVFAANRTLALFVRSILNILSSTREYSVGRLEVQNEDSEPLCTATVLVDKSLLVQLVCIEPMGRVIMITTETLLVIISH